MPLAILQPCSGPAARAHYEETIKQPVDLADVSDPLLPSDLEALRRLAPDNKIMFWGVTPGEKNQHVTKWSRISPGDVVFFARDRNLLATRP